MERNVDWNWKHIKVRSNQARGKFFHRAQLQPNGREFTADDENDNDGIWEIYVSTQDEILQVVQNIHASVSQKPFTIEIYLKFSWRHWEAEMEDKLKLYGDKTKKERARRKVSEDMGLHDKFWKYVRVTFVNHIAELHFSNTLWVT